MNNIRPRIEKICRIAGKRLHSPVMARSDPDRDAINFFIQGRVMRIKTERILLDRPERIVKVLRWTLKEAKRKCATSTA